MQLPVPVGSERNLSGGFGPCLTAHIGRHRSTEPMQLSPGRGSFAEVCQQAGRDARRLLRRTTPIRCDPIRAEPSSLPGCERPGNPYVSRSAQGSEPRCRDQLIV